MRFTAVKSFDVVERDVRIDLIGDDQKRYAVEMTADVAAQLALALQQAASHLPPDTAPIQRSQLYTLAACQPIAVSEGRQGIAITTAERFEFPLVLDQSGCNALRACIEQIERGIRHDGQVH